MATGVKKQFFSLILLCAVVGALISAFLGWQVYRSREQHSVEQFKEATDHWALALEKRISLNLEAVYAVDSFYSASNYVDKDEFEIFTAGILRHRAAQGLAWAPRVSTNQRNPMEQTARREGHENFRFTEKNSEGGLTPAGERKEYFPIYRLKPLTGNEALLGFDLGSNPAIQETLSAARDTGSTQATEGIPWKQENKDQHNFTLIVPRYDGLPKSVEERRRMLSGFFLGMYFFEEIIQDVHDEMSAENKGIALWLKDDSSPENTRLLQLHKSGTGDILAEEERYRTPLFEVGGRRWSLEAAPTKAFFEARRDWQPYGVFAVGIFATGLLIAYLLVLARRTTEVERLAQQRTKELKVSETRMSMIVKIAANGMATINEQGIVELFNPAAEQIFGYEASEVIGNNVTMLMPEPYRSEHHEYLRRYLETGVPHIIGTPREVFGRRKDGEIFPMELAVTEAKLDDRLFFTALVTDVTERKRAERELRESETRFRQLAEHLEEVFWLGDLDADGGWRLLYVNPALEKVFGITPEQAHASNSIWQDVLHEDDRERVMEVMASLGRENPRYDIEYRIRLPDGPIRWIWGKGTVVRSEDKNMWRTVEVSQDITQRHEMERRTALTQKLESIGQLAAGIAHEINTPTQYVGDNTRFLQEAFGDLNTLLDRYAALLQTAKAEDLLRDAAAEVEKTAEEIDLEFLKEEIPKAIEQSLEGVDRVASIVLAMKKFSHPDSEEKKAIDINEAIENTVTVARNEWKYVAVVELELDRSLPSVPCSPGDFNQVILNMVVNAAHAIGERENKENKMGLITLSTRPIDGYAEIRIRDTGIGIPEEVRDKIFDPFFTTKEVGKGTGQGLAIAQDIIVNKHDGSIRLESEVGIGTEFIIRLPLRDEAQEEGKTA